jgi:hypothetical protein
MRKTMQLETDSLDRLLDAIGEAVDVLGDTESVVVETDGGRDRHNNPHKATLARTTLRAAELASLLSAELHVRYWAIKGHADPRRGAGLPNENAEVA